MALSDFLNQRAARALVLAPTFALMSLALSSTAHSEDRTNGTEAKNVIDWKNWSPETLNDAKKDHRLMLLDLEAVWCHWCHVMEDKTYSDKNVIDLIRKNFVAIRVDQDSRPDISRLYEDFGWPATIFFDSDGRVLSKQRGYIPPAAMTALLKTFMTHPVPLPPDKNPNRDQSPSRLPQETVTNLKQDFEETYDSKNGGTKDEHKYLDETQLEYLIHDARQAGSPSAEKSAKRIKQTLSGAQNLIDPAWGGAYQYSVDQVWTEPHFEKIMRVQLDFLRVYSLAYAQFKTPAYLKAAEHVASYLETFLKSPEGAFYASQDADLKQGEDSSAYFKLSNKARRKLGVPRVDKAVYARENGWAIQGVLSLAMVTPNLGEQSRLVQTAVAAANWVEKNRSLPLGGFSHSEKDLSGPYLGDSLAMGQAYLELYQTTARTEWLTKAQNTLEYIAKNFSVSKAGFVISHQAPLAGLAPQYSPEENLDLARWARLMYETTGSTVANEVADQAMKYLSAPDVLEESGDTSGVLLANLELSNAPMHLTVVGSKSNPTAQLLYKIAQQFPSYYKRLDWVDPKEPELLNSLIKYPVLAKPAAFVCGPDSCSLPAFNAPDMKKRIAQSGQ